MLQCMQQFTKDNPSYMHCWDPAAIENMLVNNQRKDKRKKDREKQIFNPLRK